MNTPPVIVRQTTRASLVLGNVLIASVLSLVTLGIRFSHPALSYWVLAAVLLGAVASVARHWNDRVEVHPDHLDVWRTGRTWRVALDDVTDVAMRIYNPRQALTALGQRVLVTLTLRTQKPLEFSAPWTSIQPLLTAVADAQALRMNDRVDAGETLTFQDNARFPWLGVLGGGFIGLCVLGAVVGTAFGPHRTHELVALVRAVILVCVIAVGVGGTVVRWLVARGTGGLAVCAQGICTLVALGKPAPQGSVYRAAPGGLAPWIPWSEVTLGELNGEGLSLHAGASRQRISLGPTTTNLFALRALMAQRGVQTRPLNAG